MTKEEWDALSAADQEAMIRDELAVVYGPLGVEIVMTRPSLLATPGWSSVQLSGNQAVGQGLAWDFYNNIVMLAGGNW